MAGSAAPESGAVCVFQGTTNLPSAPPAIGSVGLATLQTVSANGRQQLLLKARVFTGTRIEHGFHGHTWGDITAADGVRLFTFFLLVFFYSSF